MSDPARVEEELSVSAPSELAPEVFEAEPEPLWQAALWLGGISAGLGVAMVFGFAALQGYGQLIAWDGPRTGLQAVGAALVGLGLGAWGWHRLRPRITAPTYLFGWLALAAALLVGVAPRVLGTAGGASAAPLAPGGLAGLLLASGALPATLLGAAVPLLGAGFGPLMPTAAALTQRALAALGAGVTAAAWWCLARAGAPLGPDAAAAVAAFALAFAGVAALAASKKVWAEPPAGWGALPPAERDEVRVVLPSIPTHAAVVLALTVPVWLRTWEVVSGSTPETRWGVLVVVAAGLTLGAWSAPRWAAASTQARLAAVPALTAGALLIGALSLDALAFRLATFEAALGTGADAWALAGAGRLLAMAGFVGVPCVGLGLLLTLSLGLLPPAALGPAVAAAGVAGGAWLLLLEAPWPLVGGLVAAALVLTVDAIDTAGRHRGWPPTRRLLALGLAATPLVGWVLLFPEPSWHALTAPRRSAPPTTWAALRVASEYRRVVVHARDAWVEATALRSSDGVELALNGVPTVLDEARQAAGRLAAHLPLALQPTLRQVCVLGLSDGSTARAAALHPLARLEVVEPSTALARAVAALELGQPAGSAGQVRAAAPLPWLRAGRQRFDLVIVTSSLRGNAPVGAAPSVELFEAVAANLTAGGAVALELDLAQHDDVTLGRTLRTLRRVFPHVTLWQTAGNHVLAIGQLAPGVFTPEATRDRLRTPKVAKDLASLGLERLPPLLMLQMQTAEGIEGMLRGTELERVARPGLPAAQARAIFARAGARSPYTTDGRLQVGAAVDPAMLLTAAVAEGRLQPSASDFKAFARYQARLLPLNELKGLDARVLGEWRRAFPKDRDAWLAHAEWLAMKDRFGEALEVLEAAPGGLRGAEAMEAKLRFSEVMGGWGWLTRRPPGLPQAIGAWEREVRRTPRLAGNALVRLAALHHAAGDPKAEFAAAEQAVAALEQMPGPGPADTRLRVLVAIARTAYWLGDEGRFRRYTEAAAALDPSDAELKGLLRLASQAFPAQRSVP
ncbi:MAG: hypothetical protein VKQ33_14980 [Candidatus Sericytochromatia bacterium]|nr:hypothetical protein [Candidatus Sericytochromatia bacterium]